MSAADPDRAPDPRGPIPRSSELLEQLPPGAVEAAMDALIRMVLSCPRPAAVDDDDEAAS